MSKVSFILQDGDQYKMKIQTGARAARAYFQRHADINKKIRLSSK